MKEISLEPSSARVRVFASTGAVSEVQEFLDGTDTSLSVEAMLRKEMFQLTERLRADGLKGKTVIFHAKAAGKGLSYEDENKPCYFNEWLQGVAGENLVIVSDFPKEELEKQVESMKKVGFQRIFHAVNKDRPLELVA